MNDPLKAFGRLLSIIETLREKCPWDKKQTIQSLKYLTIEELYELTDAITEQDMPEIKKELGDILLHIVFYSKIASETNEFDITDVINGVCDKLVERHPHIYGDVVAETEEEVKANWEQIKLKTGSKTVLSGVPKSLPSLVKSIRIQEKARGVGFDWDNKQQVWKKVNEELEELNHEIKNGNIDKIEGEFGDLLFSLVNYARFVDVNPEDALEKTNKKFIKRFTFLETESKKDGKSIQEMSLNEMNEYWEKAKKLQ